jgi:uncharacterized membrane-anchored protein
MTFDPHPLRAHVLDEVHARPFHPLGTPRRLLHFAFMTSSEEAAADREALAAFCMSRRLPAPEASARHHHAAWADGSLRWEQHSEFTTYTWDVGADDRVPFERRAGGLAQAMRALPQPGPHLVSVDLHLMSDDAVPDLGDIFDEASLAAALVDEDSAIAATDFRPDQDGFVRLLLLDRGLTPARAGALSQRMLEIETYRMLAMLGLPEAQRLSPSLGAIEDGLARIASGMTRTNGLDTDRQLLDELTHLAARLEADVAASAFRFGASRAYDGIVRQRLEAIGERAFGGRSSFFAFLNRRMAPAMRTCRMLEERQANLSAKLARAANLLRTRVDVEIERQNRDLLAAMNERTRLQLRLQQTVEGLSVAAISYYVVALASHLYEGAEAAGWLHGRVTPPMLTALTIPLAVGSLAYVVRRIRRSHVEGRS